jgi:peptide/nickel transport system permease protein
MKLLPFVSRRLFHAIFVLLGLSVVIFVIARVMPGDPARVAVGARAEDWVVDNLREQMHLNDSLPVQYAYWLRDAVQGDFGISLVTRRGVADDIKEFFPASLELALFSLVITASLGIGLGVLSAHNKDKLVDNFVRVISYMGVVTPSFVWAILFLLLFGFLLDWFPTIGRLSEDTVRPPKVTGFMTIDTLLAGDILAFFDAIHHLILPALALAMGSMAQEARITRASMSENLSKDYIAAGRAYGVSERTVSGKFLLKPSLIATISIMGLDFAGGLSNAFLVELIFVWPGLSRYGMNAILRKDLNAISAVILVLGVVFILVNIIVDVIVGRLDPRIGLRSARSD